MSLIIRIYHRLRYVAEAVLGTRFNELVWRFRHVYKRNWAEGYITSYSHPHRQLLIERISTYAPFTDVLEIGCATGPNLHLLAKQFPEAHYVGIDINPEAVKQGNLFFKQQGFGNVSLHVGKADELRFPDRSFDIVFTDAVLMYIAPDKIGKTTSEIERVSRKAVILLEHHSEQEDPQGSYREKWWLRNYTKLLKPISHEVRATKIPAEIWGGNWSKFGYIIEARR